jgi:hypothetical protein
MNPATKLTANARQRRGSAPSGGGTDNAV